MTKIKLMLNRRTALTTEFDEARVPWALGEIALRLHTVPGKGVLYTTIDNLITIFKIKRDQ